MHTHNMQRTQASRTQSKMSTVILLSSQDHRWLFCPFCCSVGIQLFCPRLQLYHLEGNVQTIRGLLGYPKLDGSHFPRIKEGALRTRAPQTLSACESPGNLVETQVQDQQGWGSAWESASLTSSQLMLVVLACGPHCEKPGNTRRKQKQEEKVCQWARSASSCTNTTSLLDGAFLPGESPWLTWSIWRLCCS